MSRCTSYRAKRSLRTTGPGAPRPAIGRYLIGQTGVAARNRLSRPRPCRKNGAAYLIERPRPKASNRAVFVALAAKGHRRSYMAVFVATAARLSRAPRGRFLTPLALQEPHRFDQPVSVPSSGSRTLIAPVSMAIADPKPRPPEDATIPVQCIPSKVEPSLREPCQLNVG